MGYALIIGGGADGRYTIQIDIGEAERTALVVRFTAQNVAAQATLADAQAALALKVTERDVAAAAYDAATALLIQLKRGELPNATADEAEEIINGHSKAQAAFFATLAAQSTALSARNAIAFTATHLAKALAAWQAQVLTETRDAWCADLTENASGQVKTLEIPGESDLILVAPGGPAPVLATDGYLRSRALMSPWQAFANAAVLPGWQKFRPTYRWGTITALDEDADTATVALADARSSAQRLRVNQSDTLTDVPIVYMTCNAVAFEVGDRVVVEFQGQDWTMPRVIGFVDNPRPCCRILEYIFPDAPSRTPTGFGGVGGSTDPLPFVIPGFATVVLTYPTVSGAVNEYPDVYGVVSHNSPVNIRQVDGSFVEEERDLGIALVLAGPTWQARTPLQYTTCIPGSGTETTVINESYIGLPGMVVGVSGFEGDSEYHCSWAWGPYPYGDMDSPFGTFPGEVTAAGADGYTFTRDHTINDVGGFKKVRLTFTVLAESAGFPFVFGSQVTHYRLTRIVAAVSLDDDGNPF